MLAETVHSLADMGNQALLLFGAKRAEKDASEAHPFGYGRERYFWAFVVSLVIFVLGGVFAVTEGIEKLHNPHSLESPGVALSILTVAIVLEAWSFRTALSAARTESGGGSLWLFVRQTKAAELPVILLEDLGALVGLVFALAGIGLAAFTGEPRFDAAGSIAIGMLLMAIAVVLAVEMGSLLVGEAAAPDQLAQIRKALLDSPHLHTTHLAPDQLLVAAKIEFDANMNVREVAAQIDLAEFRVRERVPIATLIYLEPDIYDPDRANDGSASSDT